MGDSAAQLELVRRARDGDAAAFAGLIRSFERVALAVAFSVTGDAAAAGDVTQEAFLRAWRRLPDLKEPAKFGPWLGGIVRNLALDACRARANRRGVDAGADGVPDGAAAPDAGPLDELGRREEARRVAEALGSLDELSRSAVVLRYYDGLSSRQIGELLGLAPAAVDMRLMRARRQLRERLTEPAGAAEPPAPRA